ncbi:hypothetical protein GCM10007901_05530 [Dyella acidisoli]|uniref:Aldehyde dehydrogenase domain-containing protein n=2 Tax=Dyella acidisoli TaxID=1867834 RepID=A0ABQ5XM53_9GAMM|nr:hypothetical protein GCM10007901_05530 [Dyella acidisoli]
MIYMSVAATRLDKAMIPNEQTINHPCVLVGSMFLFKSSDTSLQEPTIVINSKDAEKANAHAVSSQAFGP